MLYSNHYKSDKRLLSSDGKGEGVKIMDPTLNSIAHKILADERAKSAPPRKQRAKNRKRLLGWAGGLLIMLGQRMQPTVLQASSAEPHSELC